MDELPTLQELQSFITYSKMGNFTLAAQAANITQSAFSAQMKKTGTFSWCKINSSLYPW